MKKDKLSNFLGEEPTKKLGGNTMKTKMKKLMKNQKGMTLIELLAVIVIIAIIALIAIPAIANIINKSHDKAILSDASQILSAAKIAISDGACTAGSGTGNAAGANSGEFTCTGDKLTPYVDGVKVAATADTDNKIYSANVIKTSSGFEITYSGFANIKTSDFSAIKTAGKVSDSALATAMGN